MYLIMTKTKYQVITKWTYMSDTGKMRAYLNLMEMWSLFYTKFANSILVLMLANSIKFQVLYVSKKTIESLSKLLNNKKNMYTYFI